MRLKMIVSVTDGEVQKFSVSTSGRYVIGRGPDAVLQVPDPKLSRNHCVVELHEDRATIEDMGSLNGTTVDGVTIRARRRDPERSASESTESMRAPLAEAFLHLDRVDVKDGSVIEIGNTRIEVEIHADR